MPLTEDQRQAIRDEEIFREQVRKELSGAKTPAGFLERVSAFLETKAGFWLLTTVLAGAFATGFASLQRYINRDAINQKEAADRARSDMETVLKLGPMLTSEKPAQQNVAIVLLDGLTSEKALDSRIASQVKMLVQTTLESGLRENANGEDKARRSHPGVRRPRADAGDSAGGYRTACCTYPAEPAFHGARQ